MKKTIISVIYASTLLNGTFIVAGMASDSTCKTISVNNEGLASGRSYYLVGELSQAQILDYLDNTRFHKLFESYQEIAMESAAEQARAQVKQTARNYCASEKGYAKISFHERASLPNKQIQLRLYQTHPDHLNWQLHRKSQSKTLARAASLLAKDTPKRRGLASSSRKNETSSGDQNNARYDLKWKVTVAVSESAEICCQ